MTTQLNFSVDEQLDDETDQLIQYGTFSRDWAEEEELDELIDSLDAGRISHKQGLLRAQKLLVKFPGQLEIQNFIANRLWSLEMRDESTDVREKAWRQASALIPPGFKGQISWGYPFALHSSYFVDELTDDLSTAKVIRIQNRYGVGIWTWERAGLKSAPIISCARQPIPEPFGSIQHL